LQWRRYARRRSWASCGPLLHDHDEARRIATNIAKPSDAEGRVLREVREVVETGRRLSLLVH
jgi:hypothetical protein